MFSNQISLFAAGQEWRMSQTDSEAILNEIVDKCISSCVDSVPERIRDQIYSDLVDKLIAVDVLTAP